MTERRPRVLVANRGEIALRIIRAAHSLGWDAVAVYSDADQEARWVSLADAAVHIGPSAASKSYLDTESVVQAALATGCQYVHPGYGFLSERPEFSARVAQAGLTFVGPTAATIQRMGDKALARATAQRAGVPVVPGSESFADPQELDAAAAQLQFPMMIKAAAGGGGRGIRIVSGVEALQESVPAAQAEACSSFGDASVYLEQVIPQARHIEVQILADTHGNVVHLYERDCSVQRRRQKVLEEAPAPELSPELRQSMCAAAVHLAQEVGYVGAGTVEFVVDEDGFYFIEMNTRIQVEHPITEMITGVDLVAEQLRIAAGEELSTSQASIGINGAALEFRINAEDPTQDFFPSPGRMDRLDLPSGPGVRVDAGFIAGGQIVPYYDSLLAKVIVHGRNRQEALARSAQALDELTVEGIATTRNLHRRLVAAPEIHAGAVSTTWLEGWVKNTVADGH